MRMGIRRQLETAIPVLNGRVYDPHAARHDTPKPYAVLLYGDEREESPWAGYRRIVEVWPYVERTSLHELDALARQIIAALDDQLITDPVTGEVVTCRYTGATDDISDPEWGLTRGLRFAVLALQPVDVPETVESDQWIEALAQWTEALLGPEWSVYRNAWPSGYRRPCVLWRLVAYEPVPISRAVFEMRKQVAGHVVGRTPNETTQTVLRIVEELTRTIKVPIDVTTKRYMLVQDLRANHEVDALVREQITLIVSRRTMSLVEEAPLMRAVHFQQAVR